MSSHDAEGGGRRVRPLLLVLLWIWAVCIFLVVDLFLDVPEFDGIRPTGDLYRGMRKAAHEMVGESTGDEVAEDAAPPKPEPTEAEVRARAARWWALRLDDERDEFVAERGLDPTRPLAETPAPWRYVTFAEGLALAAAEGKPLFVDVRGLWSPWCHRLDYYTYPDAEVAALLSEHFVPLKIIQEQDHGKDYLRLRSELGAEGVPALGIWGADGKLLESLGGWAKPEDLAAKLRAAIRR